MDIIKFRAVGGAPESIGCQSKYIEWTQAESPAGSFYFDGFIPKVLSSNDDYPHYAWLRQSKAISEETETVQDLFFEFDQIFTYDPSLIEVTDAQFAPATGSWIKYPGIRHKKKNVSMISSTKNYCEYHTIRLNWVKRLRKHLDLYGRDFNPIRYKEEGLDEYMFSVAVENGAYNGYFTEKILDCFLTGTVPIYLGAPNIGDYFNLDGIITLDDDFNIHNLNQDLYESMGPAIEDNFNRALTMSVAEDYVYENYLRI